MIPGWSAEASNTLQNPVEALLPVPFDVTYEDGGMGAAFNPVVVPAITVASHVLPSATLIAEHGFVNNIYGFKMTLRKLSTFGVMLVDTIDPAEIGLEDEESAEPVFGLIDTCGHNTDED